MSDEPTEAEVEEALARASEAQHRAESKHAVAEQVAHETEQRINWRPERLESITPVDRIGRPVLHQIGMLTWFHAIPGLAAQYTTIPEEYWAQDANDEGYTVAVVACPCRREPAPEAGQLVECECHRFYLFTGRSVMVANGPKQRPKPRWERIVDDFCAAREIETPAAS